MALLLDEYASQASVVLRAANSLRCTGSVVLLVLRVAVLPLLLPS